MKKLTKKFSLIMFIVLMGMGSLIPIHAQTRGVGPEMNYEEPIMMAYYRTWRDAAMPHDSNSNLPDANVIKMTDLPKEIDIVSVFHYVNPGTNQDLFWETLKNDYVPTLHERGQRVVRTLDYKELLKIKTNTGKDSTMLTDDEYHAFAQTLIDTYMTPWNLDGLDVEDGLVARPTDPARTGYTFDGWYVDEAFTTRFDFNTTINKNMTLYAKWHKQDVSYTLSFETGDGSKVSPQTVLENTTATIPSAPTRDGYTFDGWYTTDQFTTKFDFTLPLTTNTTVYAKWQKVSPTKPTEVLPATGTANTLMNVALAMSVLGGSFIALNAYVKRKSNIN